MSTTFTAKAIIGVMVDPTNFFIQTKSKTFDHNYPEDFSHDPKSGEKLWENVWEPKEGVKGFVKVFSNRASPKFCVEGINSWIIGRACGEGDDKFIIGFTGLIVKDYLRPLFSFERLDDIEGRKALLKADLDKFDAWSEKKFGLYSVMEIH